MRLTFLSWIKNILHGINPTTGEPQYVHTNGSNKLLTSTSILLNSVSSNRLDQTVNVSSTLVSSFCTWISSTYFPIFIAITPVAGTDISQLEWELDFNGNIWSDLQVLTTPLAGGQTHILPYIGCVDGDENRLDLVKPRMFTPCTRWRLGLKYDPGTAAGDCQVYISGTYFN